MKRNNTAITGYIIAMIAIIIVATIMYERSSRKNIPIIFSSKSMLDAIWQKYKVHFLEQGTLRTMDLSKNGITTSEGESYTMLRAVWLDDHATFDASWKWTEDNLEKQGYLFSWLFGRRPDGTYGILTNQNGQNTAADADTDIAVALSFAFARWRNPQYLADAKSIITDIWDKEVIVIKGKPYLASDNVERQYSDNFVVNPSYFAPYAYRMFAVIDPAHDWNGLIDTSYGVLEQSMASPLDKNGSVGLPPDWIMIRRTDGKVLPPVQAKLSSDYSFDALRVPWRIALDWYWYHEPRAKAVLSSMVFIHSQWTSHDRLASGYSHEGAVTMPAESSSMYGGSLGALMVIDPTAAKDMYEKKLLSLYNPDSNAWKTILPYYEDNWVWFGMALYNNELSNLWATVQ